MLVEFVGGPMNGKFKDLLWVEIMRDRYYVPLLAPIALLRPVDPIEPIPEQLGVYRVRSPGEYTRARAAKEYGGSYLPRWDWHPPTAEDA